MKKQGKKSEVDGIFDMYDVDKNGVLSKDEVRTALADCLENNSDAEFDAIYSDLDANKDGTISREEFANWWKN